jgi:hypothetical protein
MIEVENPHSAMEEEFFAAGSLFNSAVPSSNGCYLGPIPGTATAT